MGLCKCPKRKVTNLFCFEHRVNVCEHCLVANHSKCIVQSYLQWLQDSDYDATCRLCQQPLNNAETVRLICYDVFHWDCLSSAASQLPATTAPAGYQCPGCAGPIFPPLNMVSPVAMVLREMLGTASWARTSLGLPMVDESTQPPIVLQESHDTTDWSTFDAIEGAAPGDSNAVSFAPGDGRFELIGDQIDRVRYPGLGNEEKSYTTLNIPEETMPFSGTTGTQVSAQRKAHEIVREVLQFPHSSNDSDEDKYRRRPAFQWLAQWLRERSTGSQSRRQLSSRKRCLLLSLLAILALLTFLVVMSHLGQPMLQGDPLLDPMQNPNIHVQPQ
uniref:Zinc finger protein-like 1 n=1 Tax=Eptatretus burgeri TaxID=7764 RepID=A0A8C4N9Y3_EPTBU